MRVPSLILLVAIGAGCASGPGTGQTTSSAGALDSAEVLSIAREAVRTNDTWLDRAEFETPRRQPDGSWTVLVWRLPKSPGLVRHISIDAKGKLTEYGGGL